jgi:hypothetical protein
VTALATSPGTASQRLRGKLSLAVPGLFASGRALLTHPKLREIYPEYLVMLHTMIRASVPLMETALLRCGELRPGPGTEPVADYFEKHIPEERHHDEWLLDDLAVLGRARADVEGCVPSPAVAAMVGSQYYWIRHVHPVALLGYIAVMEGYPPTVEHVEALQTNSGYPDQAFRTLLIHARLDVHHRDELDRLLDALPLTPTEVRILDLSALHTVELATTALSETVGRKGG